MIGCSGRKGGRNDSRSRRRERREGSCSGTRDGRVGGWLFGEEVGAEGSCLGRSERKESGKVRRGVRETKDGSCSCSESVQALF